MTLLLISLTLTAVATLVQAFWKMKTLKQKLFLSTIIIGGIIVTYFIAKDDAIKNDALQADVERSTLLLESADKKITEQSKTINEGFYDLKSQMSRQGVNNKDILTSVKSLEANVQQLTVDSKNFISQALGSTDKQGLTEKNSDINIPLGNKNAVVLDTKNQFAVSSDAPDENDKITIIINNRKWVLAPGEQTYFVDDQRQASYLVYKGLEGRKMVFFVKIR